jgi:hypothetical protein
MRLACGGDGIESAAGASEHAESPEGEAEMTYPPQPGHPDPNQPGGYPQSGGPPQQGYPQGGQQYPPTGGYQQPQYPPQGGYQAQPGYPPPGQGFGGPPAPPQKSKTGLLIGIAIGVVVVVALVITGFVAPGFFLSKSSDKAATGSTNSPAPGAPSAPSSGLPSAGGTTGDVDPAAKSAIDKFIAALNSKDVDSAFAMVCQSTLVEKSDIAQAVSGNNTYTASSYTGASASSGVVAVVLQGSDNTTGEMTVQKPVNGGDYCVSTLFVAAGG